MQGKKIGKAFRHQQLRLCPSFQLSESVKPYRANTVNPEIFARILFSRKALRHICDAKHSRLGHDLSISVND